MDQSRRGRGQGAEGRGTGASQSTATLQGVAIERDEGVVAEESKREQTGNGERVSRAEPSSRAVQNTADLSRADRGRGPRK